MSSRFVRSSKYRHVFGRSTRKEQCYDNIRISKNAWDTNLVKANPHYISVNWEASGGGAFAVIPISEHGKLPDQLPLFRGHTAAVLDTDWSPFDDAFIASASEDGKVFLWRVPEDFSVHQDPEAIQDVQPLARLTGHSRKVGHVLFNPSAQNVLASASGDYTIKLWDVDAGSSKLTLKHPDVIQSLSWSANGSLLVTTCRDKILRVWDVREQKPVVESSGHSGAKNSRVVWMGEHDRVATTGFSKMSDRQLGLWDVRAARQPIDGFQMLDQISGVCMPFWDDGTQCLYLAGKGDGNIRYYEYENDKFEYLSQHTSTDPQRGVAFLPKRGVNLHENEVMRAFRTVNDSYIEPVAFIVPRRAEVFQEDIYPPAVGLKPAMSAAEWFGGKEGLPPKISLESLFEGHETTEVAAGQTSKPLSSTRISPEKPQAAPLRTEVEPPKPAATPTAREPPPSMKESHVSVANLASRFADKDDAAPSSDDESSEFEEIQKPIERPKSTVRVPPRTDARVNQMENESSMSKSKYDTPISQPAKLLPTASDSTNTSTKQADATSAPSAPTHRSTSSMSSSSVTPSSAAAGLKEHLQDIKSMLETQNRTMLAQSEKLELLTKEVESLKSRLGTAYTGSQLSGADSAG